MEQTQTDWLFLSAVWAKNKIISFVVGGLTFQGRPRFSWKDVVNTDLYKKCFNLDLVNDQAKWRNAIRLVMQQMDLQPTMSGTRRGNDQ